eukprot:CAMPEP_0176170720 /NCGR_PEP_ID=MMETSP0120_2-20121206/87398_1 /TAXON_ID=160619 /ORGANISM="Kryptoperidinium foliaceum, Strain CCMP 1326" /LENGTH=343 /DNA_ID=CAMNT_0017508529 /DNA_START=64 /DNA_END=1095 /DNA_ORIENTATION=-
MRRTSVTADQYAPYRKHPQLFGDTFQDQWVHPDLKEITQTLPKLSPKLKLETDEVYSFDCFTPDFLDLFREELEHFYKISEEKNIDVRRPNSMNNYGVVVNEIGMRNLLTDFQQRYLWPLANVLFPLESQGGFDDHHAFIVRYNADEDLGLDMHIDDSDVTFNVCLGEPGYTGSGLTFCGNFGTSNHRIKTYKYPHQMGRAVFHLGHRRHGADDIETGTRINLIIWNHSWSYRSSEAYRQRRHNYVDEAQAPSLECLSYTHDRDFTHFRALPKQALEMDHLHPFSRIELAFSSLCGSFHCAFTMFTIFSASFGDTVSWFCRCWHRFMHRGIETNMATKSTGYR